MCNLLYPYCALILVLQIMLDAALRNTSWRCSLLDYQACALYWTFSFQVDFDRMRMLCMLDSAAYEEEMRKREADALSRYWLHAIVFQLVAQLYAALCLRVRGPACDACAAVSYPYVYTRLLYRLDGVRRKRDEIRASIARGPDEAEEVDGTLFSNRSQAG